MLAIWAVHSCWGAVSVRSFSRLCLPKLHVTLRADGMVAARKPIEVAKGVAANGALFIVLAVSRFTAHQPSVTVIQEIYLAAYTS